MARRALYGLQKAAVVFHSTTSVRRQIEKYGLVDAERLVHAPYGVSPEFTAEPIDTAPAAKLVPGMDGQVPFLLHVGSCIARKRVDVLLDVFAGVRARHPEVRLVQIGGPWTAAQQEQIERLKIAPAVLQLRGIDRSALAALYQRAALVLLPSEAEGFGIPVIEALACGSLVVASDLAVLREVGGQACVYCTVADVPQWVETVCRLLDNPQGPRAVAHGAGAHSPDLRVVARSPDRATRLAWASRFTWQAHARTILEAYERLL